MRIFPSVSSPVSSIILNAFYSAYAQSKILTKKNRFNIRKIGSDKYTITLNYKTVFLNKEHLLMVLNEWDDWSKYYVQHDLHGKTVLDVGAGCGETALLFYLHGASKVIAVENDPRCKKFLFENMQYLPIIPFTCSFSLPLLSLDHDFLKMDIEGAEKLLLKYSDDTGPCVIEAHPDKSGIYDLHIQLAKKFGLKPLCKTSPNTFLLGK